MEGRALENKTIHKYTQMQISHYADVTLLEGNYSDGRENTLYTPRVAAQDLLKEQRGTLGYILV